MTNEAGPQAHERDGNTPRAVGYVRVSSQAQEDRGFSLESQREKVEAYAREHGYALTETHIDVISTKDQNPDREGFYRVLNLIDSEQVNAVLIRGTSRLGRNMPDKVALGSKAEEHGIEIVGIDGDMTYDMESPMGEFVYYIRSALDRLENRQRSVLVEEARKKRAENGYWPQGNSPTGYRTVQGEKGRVLEPDEQAWYIPQVFAYYVEVESQQTVTDWARSIPQDVPCGQSTIGRILANKTYMGLIPRNDEWYEGRHTPLVSEELWEEARRVRRRGPGRPPKT